MDVSHHDDGSGTDDFDYSPAQVLSFVETGNSISCIVRPCSVAFKKSSVFTTQWELAFWDKEKINPMISLVSVDAIVRHCLMISADGTLGSVFHEVWEQKLWGDEFHKC